ncbi:hypothetical protein QTA56_09785 [Acinetobacter sp. VNH17]|uniref:Tetratricopeptide repeat protein n=1 Tax=Acinetobacter thutiue TaxID=2998078 RepID=A0ABT7WPC1_9GAMM|nr:hypothetical protein [Acinetobacter thutiue]MCY6412419.1 hypothetical protein [Acinetobacter thutiue]MDN0014525.1 hypothetical protein [Acinetobacter thutiue]
MRFALMVLVVVLFVITLFLPGLSGDFILDDGANILSNYLLYIHELNVDDLIYAALSFHDGNGSRALPMMSFALDYWRAGSMDVSAFKATNLFIHAITTFVLALFFRRLLLLAKWTPQQAAWGALALTLLWAVHPLQVSSVLYIVQRMQTMATLFLVSALWSYLLMRQNQISGGRGRIQGILVIIFWLLALSCKEDAVLLPVYTLLLELTVLQFKAGQAVVARGLKQSYSLFVILAVLLYIFVIIPRFGCWKDICWQRDFNSGERLLTQGRVLVMYLGQIIFPLSDRLPFIYDNYPISRSLWQPWTTLPCLLIIASLIVWGWRWRHIRPLFAFGILLFFAGHFISSNVILLEMVFEHRNHLPLIGTVLALGDLVLLICQRLQFGQKVLATVFVVIALLLTVSTLHQTYIWGDTERLGQKMTKLVPTSTRAWNQYAAFYFSRYNVGKDPNDLIHAIEVMEQAFKNIPSPLFVSNIIIYKSILGNVQEQDWQNYYQSLDNANNNKEKKQSFDLLLADFLKGFDIDENKLIRSMEVIERKGIIGRGDYFIVANKVYNSKRRDRAIVFFKKAVEVSSNNDPMIQDLIDGLADGGHMKWVDELQKVRKQKTEKNISSNF